MPQMYSMNWVFLYIMFTYIFYMYLCNLYFFFFHTPKNKKTYMKEKKIMYWQKF